MRRHHLDIDAGAPGAVGGQLVEGVRRRPIGIGRQTDMQARRVRGRAWNTAGRQQDGQNEHRCEVNGSGRPPGRYADARYRVDHETQKRSTMSRVATFAFAGPSRAQKSVTVMPDVNWPWVSIATKAST